MILLKIFYTFFKIGAFTFGGGYAMLPFIQQEVIKNEWLTKEQLIDFIGISESTPGPFAINVSTFVGMKTAGILGALCATLGVVIPSFVIILLVAKMFEKFKKSRLVNGAMLGLKGAVVGLIGSAVITTLISVFGDSVKSMNIADIIMGGIVLAGTLFGLKKKISPVILIIASAVGGIVLNSIIKGTIV